MKVDLQNMSFPMEYISNCYAGTEEGEIINLHPHFTIPESQLHKDRTFPWLVDSSKVYQAQMAITSKRPKYSSLEEKLEYIRSIQSRPVGWKIINKAWSLIQNERDDLAQNYLVQYKDPTFDGPQELNHILFHFCWDLTKPKNWLMYLNANILAAGISQKFPSEYNRFKDYYLTNLCSEHLQRYFDIFSEYFQDYSEFNQTFMFAQYDLSLPQESQASSQGFKRTKMFYGNAFEVLTSNFTILACLNNILNGRRYDTFNKMDLAKYLTIDKANRGNPFKDTQPFSEFFRELDSVLRNASHHGAMRIDRNNKVIYYRSGGTGSPRTISYSEYLYKCNEIFLKIAALLLLELTINFSPEDIKEN